MPTHSAPTVKSGPAIHAHWRSDELGALLARATDRRYSGGSMIFRRGDPGDTMMRIKEGLVRIGIGSADGREMSFAILGPGQMFGEIAVIDGRGRTADAIALGDCVVQVVQRRDFLAFLEQRPAVAVRLLQMLCERVRQADTTCESLAFVDLEGRLAALLLELAERQGTEEGDAIAMKLSQEELGRLVVASREAVNRQLRNWQSAGLIAMRRQQIVLTDIEALRELAQRE